MIIEYIKALAPEITIIGALTLVQIAPIKIHPWSWLAKLLQRANGVEALQKEVARMDERIKEVKRDNARTRSKVIRKEIIDFAEELRRGKLYSVSEFEEIARIIDEYRGLIKEHGFKNAYCVAQMSFIEAEMQKRGVQHEKVFDE